MIGWSCIQICMPIVTDKWTRHNDITLAEKSSKSLRSKMSYTIIYDIDKRNVFHVALIRQNENNIIGSAWQSAGA